MSSGPNALARRAALLAALAYLALSALLAPAYGPVWDCVMGEYPHGEAALSALRGEGSYHELCMGDTGARPRQPHPFFDPGVRLPWNGTYPLTGIASALSCELLWTRLGLVPALRAHDLPVQLLVALLVYAMVRALGARFGLLAGLSAALLLLCQPRFLAHSFNNLKDAPEAVFYGLAVLALFLALTRGGLARWLVAGACIGLALAQRPNALFLPVQMGLFLLGAIALRARAGRPRLPWSWGGLAAAFALFLVVYYLGSPGFWADPWTNAREQLLYHLRFNVFFNDESAVQGALEAFQPVVSTHGLVAFLGTTPPAILLLALAGLAHPRLSGEERWLLLLGVVVPVGRTLLPGMANYDGVRHFLEAFPPLAALAGLGLALAVQLAGRLPALARHARTARAATALALVATPLAAAASTHPDGIAYWNAFAGGLSGARARGIPDATDYWGSSYWRGLAWLAAHAEPGAGVLVPLATHVARCGAPVQAPDGPPVLRAGDPPADPVYLMYVTRSAAYGPLLRAFDGERPPAHEILCQGVPILRILRLAGPDAIRAQELLGEEDEALREVRLLLAWGREHKDRIPALMEATIAPEDAPGDALRKLEAMLPPELHEAARAFLWSYRRQDRQ